MNERPAEQVLMPVFFQHISEGFLPYCYNVATLELYVFVKEPPSREKDLKGPRENGSCLKVLIGFAGCDLPEVK